MGLCFRSGTKRARTAHWWLLIDEQCTGSTPPLLLCALSGSRWGLEKWLDFVQLGVKVTQSNILYHPVLCSAVKLQEVERSSSQSSRFLETICWVGDWLYTFFLFIFLFPSFIRQPLSEPMTLSFCPSDSLLHPSGRTSARKLLFTLRETHPNETELRKTLFHLKRVREIKDQQRNTGMSTETFFSCSWYWQLHQKLLELAFCSFGK